MRSTKVSGGADGNRAMDTRTGGGPFCWCPGHCARGSLVGFFAHGYWISHAGSLMSSLNGHDWRSKAACVGADGDLFFNDENGGDYSTARSYCERCPVAAACLRDALSYEGQTGQSYRFGMFGGLTPKERHELVRSRSWKR